jgi:hypothetical protein
MFPTTNNGGPQGVRGVKETPWGERFFYIFSLERGREIEYRMYLTPPTPIPIKNNKHPSINLSDCPFKKTTLEMQPMVLLSKAERPLPATYLP